MFNASARAKPRELLPGAASEGRLTDAFMEWWAAYAELLQAGSGDERGRTIVLLEAKLDSARAALARERVAASRPPHELLHAVEAVG